ncbi:diguanylate cyclase [Aminipila butyrica]|uniref:Diguanylate cyclase n=1 Tax=Aminipila butyrica TaxID=433296 RepID=A0A858BRV6_9FIRM|nr:diguanylate cyclase [Aminipila butyrica]QIB68052.1 diguanylate cyclase [Aminipila butyrica]
MLRLKGNQVMPYQKLQVHIIALMMTLILAMSGSFFAYQVYAEDEESQKVRVGYYQLDGFNDISQDGYYSGYGYEYLMEIAKYTGWEYELVGQVQDLESGITRRMTYEEALNQLEEGKLDLVCHVEKTAVNQGRFLFPDFPLGEDYGLLTVAAEGDISSLEELQQSKGLRVGMLTGTSRDGQLQEYGRKLEFSFEPVFFSTVEALKEALLEDRSIDAIYATNMRQINGERALLRLNAQDFFAVTNKGAKQLCGELSAALDQIAVQNPQFSADLYKKYYTRLQREKVNWTQEEQEYLAAHPVIRVGVDKAFIPIEYYDEKKGQIAGISGDILQQVADMMGVQIEGVPYSSFRDLLKEDGSYKIDLLPAFGADYKWAAEHRVRLTSAYLNLPVSVISQYYVKNYEDPKLKVAVVRDKFLTAQIQDTMSYEQLIYCNSLKECVEAVNDGKAELTYIPTYSANYFASQAAYTRIRTYAVPDFNYQVCFAIPMESDVVFYKILNKAINSISPKEIDNIVFSNIIFDGYQESFFDYVYKYPILTALVICFLWMGISLVLYFSKRLEKDVKQELELCDERMYLALEQTNMVVWDYDLASNSVIRTRGSKSWLGADDRIDNAPETFIQSGYVHPNSVGDFETMFQQIQKGDKFATGLFQFKKAEEDGQWTNDHIWVEIKMTNIFDGHGKAVRAVGLAEDVTEKLQEAISLREKASRDPLTHLLNRTSFQVCVQEFLKKDYREDLVSALIILDTDDFKQVNDTHGHVYGDEVLMEIATRLTGLFRTEDCVGRLGGDEFIIFMKNATSYEGVLKKAEQICTSLVFEKDGLVTTCSVGAAIAPSREVDYAVLYKYADEALYEAKKDGKRRYVVYNKNQIH